MPEYFDILDKQTGELTGRNELRNLVHRNGLYHSCVHLWIFDLFDVQTEDDKINTTTCTTKKKEARLLLQRRSATKESFPYYFDISSAGHLSSGENHLVCVVRELYEELGILIQFDLQAIFPQDQGTIIQSKLDIIRKTLYPRLTTSSDNNNNNNNDNTHNFVNHNDDSEDLRQAVIAAQYLFENTQTTAPATPPQSQLQDTTLDTTELIEFDTQKYLNKRYPSKEYPVIVSTLLNPTFSRQTTLHFCGKFLQDSVVLSDEYIDNEFAFIFFLKDKFITLEQSQKQLPEEEEEQKQSQHIVQFLDDEVASVVYIPFDKYLQLQQNLTDLKKDATALSSPHEQQQQQDRTVLDVNRISLGDEVDVLNQEWLVPITNLSGYYSTVFEPMMTLVNQQLLNEAQKEE